ncbi:helix-turn-helix domain-containing protein [Cellulomonas denverensis]|uniref:Helix-turn-helix transcriptional regulator n=1 Tax=Cellulomonas denverensis TaxID=264297 RepID=A0A7X6QY35_9CELL|nr:helix-turn-helix domain-containing protein [Cellulomonas denverensis]NKY21715.1 helix-turn-helix transcriptional regulator [Cellulomonas denverensis]
MTHARLLPARSLPLLGEAIKTLRREQGLTQAELARAADVSRRWVGEVEAGTRTGAELARALRVLDALGASLMIRDDRDGS